MRTDDIVIRLKQLDSIWVTLGADSPGPSIFPENVVLSANAWGSDTASFDLRRDPGAMWPDLQAFTPIDIDVAGQLVWSGRLKETPSRDGDDPVINVQGEGWQYHLDDDVYAAAYVHSDSTAWRDARSFLDADLTRWSAVATVSDDNGIVSIAHPAGTTAPASMSAGVVLDLGPNASAASVSVAFDSSNNSGVHSLFVRGGGSVAALTTTANDVGTATNNASASGTIRGTFPTQSRYVAIFMFTAGGSTPATDVWFKLKSIRVFSNDAYRSSDDSVLTASTVVADAISQATAQLSSDTSKIGATSFTIPDFHFEQDPKTPRETIDAVNAFHNYKAMVDVDRRLVFAPRPSAPAYEIGAWGGATFEDASMNAGTDINNRVLVTGTGPDGMGLMIERVTGDDPSAQYGPTSSVVIPNPSFDTNTADWTNSGSFLTRDTVVTDSLPAAGKITATATFPSYTETVLPGTLLPGVTYKFNIRAKGNAGGEQVHFYLSEGATAAGLLMQAAGVSPLPGGGFGSPSSVLSTTFQTFTITYTPTKPVTNPVLGVYNGIATMTYWLDSLAVFAAAPTIASRQGFLKTKILPIDAALTVAVGEQIGDTYLASHKTQPLQGTVVAQRGGLREVLGGAEPHPASLLRATNQRLRLAHRVDPDTGALGRDGTIASVSYDHNARTSTIALDSERRNFESLLSRYSAIAGNRVR